jgi:flagellar biogenesis protein FliO
MPPRAVVRGCCLLGLVLLFGPFSRADELPTASLPARAKHALPEPSGHASRSASSAGSPGWWLAPVGLVAALAAFGGVVMAARRFTPGLAAETSGQAPRVIGRTPLTPRHMIHLVRSGDRVLLIGTGPQGPPSLLGELNPPTSAGGDA